MKRKTIVKVQRPLSPSDGRPPGLLLYSRDKSIFYQGPSPELERWLGNRAKVYVSAVHRKDGMLEILDIVPDQEW